MSKQGQHHAYGAETTVFPATVRFPMVFNVFRAILCCCQSPDENDDLHTYDERMHLIIPETIEPAGGDTDEDRSNQRRRRERLTEIVRSIEGRMVNVASRVPFNLHNRVITKAQSQSSSRSTYSANYENSLYQDFYPNHEIVNFRKERSKYCHGLGRLRSTSPSFHGSDPGPVSRTRSPSPIAVQPSAARLLNIRLVGYSDPLRRGRALERTEHPTGLPGLRRPDCPTAVEEGATPAEGSPSQAPRPVTFALQYPDVNAMILTWD